MIARQHRGSEKHTDPAHDYLIPSLNLTNSPGLSASLAVEFGTGSLTDNYGNVLIGHELICPEHGEYRDFHLSFTQWDRLKRAIEPSTRAADNQMRHENKIPTLNGAKSPLEIMHHELDAASAPYTPLGKTSTIHR